MCGCGICELLYLFLSPFTISTSISFPFAVSIPCIIFVVVDIVNHLVAGGGGGGSDGGGGGGFSAAIASININFVGIDVQFIIMVGTITFMNINKSTN